MGMERVGASLPSLNAKLPAGVASGLLAANRAFTVWALASSYKWEPETSSHGMEQGKAEIRALRVGVSQLGQEQSLTSTKPPAWWGVW